MALPVSSASYKLRLAPPLPTYLHLLLRRRKPFAFVCLAEKQYLHS